jgi:hypothetical protein
MDSLQQISDKKFVNENQQNIFLKKRIYTLMRKIQYKLCNKTCKNIQRDFSSCDPLFITEFGQPLDRNYFIGKLKHVLQLIGYDSSLYNGHSF